MTARKTAQPESEPAPTEPVPSKRIVNIEAGVYAPEGADVRFEDVPQE